MVLLHSLDARAAAGVTRYSRELATALRDVGEPVRELRLRPWEVPLGRRRVGGFLSLRLKSAFRPFPFPLPLPGRLRRRQDLLHSTFHYAAHPRCDLATVHDLFPESRSAELGFGKVEVAAMRRTTARLLRRKVHLVCVSEATRSTFQELHPEADPQRIHVAPPGIAARFAPAPPEGDRRSRRRPHPAFRPDRVNVLCVADLNPRKRFDWLLEAALDVDDPLLHVVHAGPATVRRAPWAEQRRREEPLEQELGHLGDGRLTRLGRLDDDALLAAYQSADLLVLPTLDEGFGFPPLEALACGTPVAVTDLPVFATTLGDQADRFTGPSDLARLLRHALAQGPGAVTVAERAKRHAWVMRRHGWPAAAKRLADVYRTVEASKA